MRKSNTYYCQCRGKLIVKHPVDFGSSCQSVCIYVSIQTLNLSFYFFSKSLNHPGTQNLKIAWSVLYRDSLLYTLSLNWMGRSMHGFLTTFLESYFDLIQAIYVQTEIEKLFNSFLNLKYLIFLFKTVESLFQIPMVEKLITYSPPIPRGMGSNTCLKQLLFPYR